MIKLLTLTLLTLTLSGCIQPPFPLVSPSMPDPSNQSELVDVFFVMDTPKGLRLYKEQHPKTTNEEASFQAIKLLLSGAKSFDPDYVNLWGAGTTLTSFSTTGHTAVIDLATWNLNVGSEGEARALDQLLYTLMANDRKIRALQITKNGESIESLAGHLDLSTPFVASNPTDSLAGLDIALEQGETVNNPIVIEGVACVFEASINWEISSGDSLVQSGVTLAESSCPDFGNWIIEAKELPPGSYKIRVWESSPKDGSLVVADDKNFTVEQ
jgi:hypothetical protein